MPPKKKNPENTPLPKNWRLRRGVYWYRVPVEVRDQWEGKTEYPLGRTLTEAHKAFAERVKLSDDVHTMRQLFDRYELEVVSQKAPATQKSNRYSLQRLRAVFGDNHVNSITAKEGFQYRDHCARVKSKKAANLDIEVLSHAMTKAVEWGVIDRNPIKGAVGKFRLKGRKRYVTDAELMAFGQTLERKWQLYISLKLFTGRRKGELLRLKISDLTEDGIRFTNNKDSDDIFMVSWTPELRAIMEEIIRTRGRITSMHLFCTKRGQPYIKDDGSTYGFDSIWQRKQKAALEKGIIGERFTEHDLRAKAGSDTTLERARELLRHSNVNTTQKHYRRKLEQIKPR